MDITPVFPFKAVCREIAQALNVGNWLQKFCEKMFLAIIFGQELPNFVKFCRIGPRTLEGTLHYAHSQPITLAISILTLSPDIFVLLCH